MVLFTGYMKIFAVIAVVSSLQALADTDFQWNKLEASDKLVWTPCYSGLQCSLLQVPLDYSSASAGTASIAIARYPANCTKSAYRGPILLNDGGPGGSGVDYVVEVGASIATIIGEQFDIVGFDPRGVSYSTPTVSFFRTAAERALWIPPTSDIVFPALNQTADAVAQQWARAQILGQLAVSRNDGNYIQHITTDNTARDMLRITQAFGFEKVQYWGVSYGSVLGSTFAAMFPDKVGRIVVDGVMPMDTWRPTPTKPYKRSSMAARRRDRRPVHLAPPSSIEVAANLDALFAAIEIQPVPVITPVSYGVVDYTFLRNSVFHALYSPYDSFVALAQGLADLAKGNATTLYTAEEVPPFECNCNSTTPFHENGYEALVAISCGDMAVESDTVSQLQAYYASIQAISSIADMYGNWRVVCSGWKLHREDSFKGITFTPFLASCKLTHLLGPFGAPNTSFPLLVVGNTADPVTPIAGAKSTVDAFPGSVLLTIDAPGHTSLGAPSTCFYGYLRQYFQNGTLPPQSTICQPDGVLFPPPANGTTEDVAPRGLNAWEPELIEGSRTLRKAVRRSMARRLNHAV
ncbi:AB hydrolase-1 domain-containing protein [Mycena venus]|uniref:AB hydrolase-1 domain-containing protein n=1 Tax=Mycena venus TaxID=2733690 RepID=A0A8H7CIM1_9AGAR|nr:AB hydrolase-1 domain-containing protein [Mycena venus]